MFKGRQQIRDAYRRQEVASAYIDERFLQPLGALLHARQVRYLREAIQDATPTSVLELAPGPARLTVDVAETLPPRTVLLDTSAQMLAAAGDRLQAASRREWLRVQGDAFRLPFGRQFDFVYSFRLIRHFEAGDRHALYREIGRVLRPGGRFVFDAINAKVYSRVPDANGARQHYDAAIAPSELRAELGECGFDNVVLKPVQRGYPLLCHLQILVAPRSRTLARAAMEVVDRAGGADPLEWVVVCRRG
jgi:ubiquinone/menaquinone biosynthesis C-methylase UbiE